VPSNAVDGKLNSRWAILGPKDGVLHDPPEEQWLQLDIIILEWERTYSRDYDIQIFIDECAQSRMERAGRWC
jgi:hypothetical protein